MPVREQTVIFLLTAAGHPLGLPIAVVRDALQVSRGSRGGEWRVRGAVPGSRCDGRVIDVGGQEAPLIDVCALLGAPHGRACHGRTRSVVVVQCGERWLGLLADTVGDIVEVPLTAIEPWAGPAGSNRAIREQVRLDDRMIGLLDADHLVDPAVPLALT